MRWGWIYIQKCWLINSLIGFLVCHLNYRYIVINNNIFPNILLKYLNNINSKFIYILLVKHFVKNKFIIFDWVEGVNNVVGRVRVLGFDDVDWTWFDWLINNFTFIFKQLAYSHPLNVQPLPFSIFIGTFKQWRIYGRK